LAAPFFFFNFFYFDLQAILFCTFSSLALLDSRAFVATPVYEQNLMIGFLSISLARVSLYMFFLGYGALKRSLTVPGIILLLFFSRVGLLLSCSCFPCFWTLLRPGGNGMDNSGIGNTKRPVDLK
jgi:hypothetical protein